MNPRLIAISGPTRGTVFAMPDGEVSVGRDPANAVCINDPSVSRRHCLIRCEAGACRVEDLDSFNGTFVNGVPIGAQPLSDGDRIGVGNVVLLFLCRDEAAEDNLRGVELDACVVTRSMTRLRREDALYLQPESLLASDYRSSRAVRDLNALLKVSMAINSVRDMDTLQRRLLELILEVTPAERAAILLADAGAPDFVSAFGWSRSSGAGASVRVSSTVARQVMQGGEAVLCNDVGEGGAAGASDSLVAQHVKSLLCVPLSIFERMIGVIYCDTANPAAPFDEEHLQLLMAVAGVASVSLENIRHVELLSGENRRLRQELGTEFNMIGESAPMQRIYQRISRVAPSDTTVLICGESGTGKELAARAIHAYSERRENAFVAINCATLTEALLESELFGHEKGAFTGAVSQKKGRIEVAERGTIFFDEVGELPLSVQPKLLRVLQERQFERLGSTRPIKADVRVIAATNKDLEAAVKQGSFRKDLYYRLNVVSLTMPALSERCEDIPLLASYFVSKYSKKCKRKVAGITPEARACLTEYGWPGNVRELENAIEHAIVLGTTDSISLDDLPDAIIEGRRPSQQTTTKFYRAIVETKKHLIIDALKQADDNYIKAAELLGIHPNNLHRLIRTLGLKNHRKSDE
jgi:transcriptional regulator with GAF, ATPase, and Fis domain